MVTTARKYASLRQLKIQQQNQEKPESLADRIRALEMNFADIDAEQYPIHKYYAEKKLGEAYAELMKRVVGAKKDFKNG